MLRITCSHEGLSCHTGSYLQQEQGKSKAAHLLLRSHVVVCSLIQDICIIAEGSCLAWVWVTPILMQVGISCS